MQLVEALGWDCSWEAEDNAIGVYLNDGDSPTCDSPHPVPPLIERCRLQPPLDQPLLIAELVAALAQPRLLDGLAVMKHHTRGALVVPRMKRGVFAALPEVYGAQQKALLTERTLEEVWQLFLKTDIDGSGLLDADEVLCPRSQPICRWVLMGADG